MDHKIVLKEKPLAPANNEQYNETLKGYNQIFANKEPAGKSY